MNRVLSGSAAILLVILGTWLLLEDGKVRDTVTLRELSREDLQWTLHGDPFAAAPASLLVRKCMERQEPEGTEVHLVLGCRVDMDAADLEPWIAAFGSRLTRQPMPASLASLDLFDIDPGFTPITVYGMERPAAGRQLNGVLLLVNERRDGALLYEGIILAH